MKNRSSFRRTMTAAVATGFLTGAAPYPAPAAMPRVHPTSSADSRAAGTQNCPGQMLARMSLPEKVGQLFMVGVDAHPTAAQRRLVARHHVGSVLLAQDSSAGVAATARRVARLQSAANASRVQLWVAADQEGGYVQHLSGPGFSDIPTALTQGTWPRSILRSRAHSWGDQLRAAGVNLNLAPVADTVSTQLGGGNPPIGYYYREYGHHPHVVSGHALAVERGMHDATVQTAVKHFPGLGRVRGNTDTTYGVTDEVTTRHGRYAVQPFRDLVNDQVPLVMVSSARYTKIDADHIGPMSSTLIRGMLRHDIGFTGTVISDSLTATALSHVSLDKRALRFLRAGGDLALVGDSTAAEGMIHAVLHQARQHRHHRLINRAVLHVLRSKSPEGLLTC